MYLRFESSWFAARESGGIAIRRLVKRNSLGDCSVRRNGDCNRPLGGCGKHPIDTSTDGAPLQQRPGLLLAGTLHTDAAMAQGS